MARWPPGSFVFQIPTAIFHEPSASFCHTLLDRSIERLRKRSSTAECPRPSGDSRPHVLALRSREQADALQDRRRSPVSVRVFHRSSESRGRCRTYGVLFEQRSCDLKIGRGGGFRDERLHTAALTMNGLARQRADATSSVRRCSPAARMVPTSASRSGSAVWKLTMQARRTKRPASSVPVRNTSPAV